MTFADFAEGFTELPSDLVLTAGAIFLILICVIVIVWRVSVRLRQLKSIGLSRVETGFDAFGSKDREEPAAEGVPPDPLDEAGEPHTTFTEHINDPLAQAPNPASPPPYAAPAQGAAAQTVNPAPSAYPAQRAEPQLYAQQPAYAAPPAAPAAPAAYAPQNVQAAPSPYAPGIQPAAAAYAPQPAQPQSAPEPAPAPAPAAPVQAPAAEAAEPKIEPEAKPAPAEAFPPYSFLQTLPFTLRDGLRTGHAELYGVSIEAVFFPADFYNGLDDTVRRLVPFLPAGRVVCREADRRTFSASNLYAQPDAVIDTDKGLVCIEYKSKGGREDAPDILSTMRPKDMLQTLIETMVLSASEQRPAAAVLRTVNAAYFLRPGARIAKMLSEALPRAQAFIAPYSELPGLSASLYAELFAALLAAGSPDKPAESSGEAAHAGMLR
jgi:hypothetical protein